MNKLRLEVYYRNELENFYAGNYDCDDPIFCILAKARQFSSVSIEAFHRRKVYRLSSKTPFDWNRVGFWVNEVFMDPVWECSEYGIKASNVIESSSFFVDIYFKYGVTDNVAKTAEEALGILGDRHLRVYSGESIFVRGDFLTTEKIRSWILDSFANDLLQNIEISDLRVADEKNRVLARFDKSNIKVPSENEDFANQACSRVEEIDIFLSDWIFLITC